MGEIAPGVPLDDFLPYLLNRIANRLNMDLAEDLKTIGMTVPQYRVLAVLEAGDGRSVGELAVYTVTEQSTLSKILRRMRESGLIERRTGPRDGRVVKIHITLAGREGIARALPIALKHYSAAIAALSGAEHDALVAMLHKVLSQIREHPIP